MPFSDEDVKLIQKNMQALVVNTTEMLHVTMKLLQEGIITQNEMTTTMSYPEGQARNYRFYTEIVKKDSSGFDILVDGLKETGQHQLAALLATGGAKRQGKSNSAPKPSASGRNDEIEEDDDFDISSVAMPNTAENIEKLRDAFTDFDTSGDGKISGDEFYKIMEKLGWSKQSAKKLLEAHDTDGDKELDFFEFKSIFHQKPSNSLSDFRVTEKMNHKIRSILEDDYETARRWFSIMEQMVLKRDLIDLEKLEQTHEKISKTLSKWMSVKTKQATFNNLIQIIAPHSPSAAEQLEENRDDIKRLG